MKLEDLKDHKIKPLRDLVALEWLPSRQTKTGILIPDSYYDFGLKLGKLFLCRVLAKGPKAREVKVGDRILIHEYGIIDFPGGWKEGEIYFTEEKNCKAKVTGLKTYLPSVPLKIKEETLEKTL